LSAPLHLDAIVAAVRMSTASSADLKIRPRSFSITDEPEDYRVPLPFAKQRYKGLSWYRASAAILDGVPGIQFWTKKWDREHEDYLSRDGARTVTLTNAALREYKVPLMTISASEAIFYAVGNRRKLYNSLRRIRGRSIGKKGSQGYGRVREVEVTELPGDWQQFDSDWRTEDGMPARVLPVEWWLDQGGKPLPTRRAPIMPPYWRILDRHTQEVVG